LVLAKDEVTRCRTSVTVIPSSGPYEAGDVLTCVSNGYTEPIYKWTDSKGVVVFNGPNITLTNSLFVLNCTATDSLTNSCIASVVVRNSEGMLFRSLLVYLSLCIINDLTNIKWWSMTQCSGNVC